MKEVYTLTQKWGNDTILSYIRKSLALKLILRIRPQIMCSEILAGSVQRLRENEIQSSHEFDTQI